MVEPNKLGHNFIDLRDVRLVNVLTQNTIKAGDMFIQSSKSRKLVNFLSQVVVHLYEIIASMVGVNCGNATTVHKSMTISQQRCIEVATHNLQITGLDADINFQTQS